MTSPASALPPVTSAVLPIPSISFETLLTQRDAALARLDRISQAVKDYKDIGDALAMVIKRQGEEQHTAAHYKYRSPFDRHQPHELGSLDWLQDAKAIVDAALWDLLLDRSGLRSFFDAKARKEWDEQIEKNQTPSLTLDNVSATFRHLHAQRGDFFERGIIALFRSLSWDYKTNQPQMFGKRIIVRYVLDRWGYPSSSRTDGLDDLLRAFHVLDGKPEPDHRAGVNTRFWQRENGEDLVDDYLQIKTYKNGNAHVTFRRPDLVDQLNRVIAKHCPDALPPSRD